MRTINRINILGVTLTDNANSKNEIAIRIATSIVVRLEMI